MVSKGGPASWASHGEKYGLRQDHCRHGCAARLAARSPWRRDDPTLDCLSEDNERRISGCSAMIDTPGLPDDQRSLAYGMRALAYSLLGMFDKALRRLRRALTIKPDFPLALNNRAWAYFKLGRPQ